MATFTVDATGGFNVPATWGTAGLSGAGSPASGTHYPGTGDHVVIPSGVEVSLDADHAIQSIDLDGGTLTGAGRTLTLNKSSGRVCDFQSGTISGVLDVIMSGTHSSTEDMMADSGNIRNLTLSGDGRIVTIGRPTVITGNLEVSHANSVLIADGSHSFTCVLCHGNGTVKTGSGTFTATNDWRPDATQLQADGGTFTGIDHLGGAFDCNSKQVTIGCKRIHSGITMTNGTTLIADNSAEDVIVTVTAAESNASIYGPLQGRINLVTNSSGSKDFVLKEDLVVNGRIVVSGSGEFRTYDGSNTFDLLADGATFHNSNDSSNYSCLDMKDSAKFLSGSSSVILDAALGSNLCDIGSFNGTDGQAVTGWTAYGSNTILYDSNQAKITYVDNATGAYFMLNSTALSTSGLTVGKVYKAKFKAKVNTGSVNLKWTTQSSSLPFGLEAETNAYQENANTRNENLASTSYVWRCAYFVAGFATGVYLYVSNMGSGQVVHIDDMEIYEVMANGSTGSAGHKKSYGLDLQTTSTACNLGTGFFYSVGSRIGGQNHTKSSGRYCSGSGDSTEYFTGGGNTLDFNNTDMLLLGNSGAVDTIGFNIGNMTWNCRGFYYYLSSASNWLVYWNHDNAPTVNSASSSTAAKIHTVSGDVHILKGELRSAYHDADRDGVGLVYAGELTVYDDATLNLKVSDFANDHVDHSFGSMTIKSGGTLQDTPKTTTMTSKNSSNYIMDLDGTFTHHDGTVRINSTGSGDQLVDLIPSSGTLYDLQINENSSQAVQYNGNTTIANDLTIVEGIFQFYDNTNSNLTVTRHVKIESGGQLGAAGWVGAGAFNTLTVDSGGTYQATSGTTTIAAASGAPSNSRAFFVANAANAFVANKGLMSFTASSPQVEMVSNGGAATHNTFYDVLQNNGVMQWKGEHTHVLNNFTGRGCQFNGGTGNLTVDGICRLTAGQFNASDTSTRSTSHLGTLIIESGATVSLNKLSISCNSIRNLGTILGQNTITVKETNGLIEGNMGPANVDLNLDPIYGNFNATTSILTSQAADHDDIFAGNGGAISAWIYPKTIGENSGGRIADKAAWIWQLNGESGNHFRIEFTQTYDGDNGTWITTEYCVPKNAWTHVAVVFDSDDTNDCVIYINGVAKAVTESGSGPSGTNSDDSSSHLTIGNRANTDRTFDGYIMDFKIYKNVAVTATDVAKMASKINVHPDAIGLTGLQGWYKLNASTTADSSGESNDITTAANMGSVVYDVFNVDVQDNSTTMGHANIYQGKLNPKSLAYPNLDGSADYVPTPSALQAELRTSHSWSAWVKSDDGVNGNDAIVGTRNAANEDAALFYIDSAGKISYYYSSDGDVKYAVENSASFVDNANPWKHVVATMSYTDASNAVMKVFVNGVERELNSTNNGAYSGNMGDYTSADEVWIGAEDNNNVARFFFNGGMRDVKFFDYALNPDQVNSLYSGSYNVTPLVWYKLDEGNYNALDHSGRKTSMDTTGVSLSWTNGTLNVEGMRVLGNGGVD